MSEELPDFSRLPEDSARKLHSFGIGSFVLLLLFLVLAVIYSIGEKVESFRWNTFRNGMFSFGLIILSVCLTIAGITLLMRGVALAWPEVMTGLTHRRKLKRAKRAVTDAIAEKHRLGEERARLTAQLKATFLFEKESTRAANAQASREFRDALQSSVMRSCQIALDHISQLVEQYEQVVAEIQDSQLPDPEKADLLNSLTRQLDIAACEERNKDAQKMMEAEIWKVRFRKARLLARDQTQEAVNYLTQISGEARSPRMKARIKAMIETLTSSNAAGS